METIRIQNLKSIIDSGEIELKDMTVVIGKNSSGKSTLLRVFPLLKQSIAKRLSSPILWYGDYVDFGSFNKALNKDSQNNEIKLTFSFKELPVTSGYLTFERLNMSLSLTFDDKHIKEYLINFSGFGELAFKLRGKKYYELYINNELVENIRFRPAIEDSFFPKKVATQKSFYNYQYRMMMDDFVFESGTYRRINRDGLSPVVLAFDKEERLKICKKLLKESPKFVFREDDTKMTAEKIADLFLEEAISDLLNSVEKSFKSTFENVQYFGPLRSRGDRFYRVQGLNVEEVDSNGDNAPMILYRMNDAEKKKFKDWCMDNLGFYYDTEDIGDGNESTSVIVRCDKNKDNYNMTDVGFGYSQIFPIILSIWISFFSNMKGRDVSHKIIVIEQPELHLHPAFQKKIIRTFFKLIELVKSRRKSLQFVIETHSETIVNYLGYLVSDGVIDKNVTNLLVCEKNNNESIFNKMIFNQNGTIQNWPTGFFSDDE